MLTRILTVALAAGSLASVTVHAQTIGMPGGGSAGSDKTRPNIAPTTSPSEIHQPMSPGSDKTRPSGGATSDLGRPSQAQQSMGSSNFDPSKYKTQTECLNAASFVSAQFSLCKNLK
ncbi:MAG TPA: hypothetical protein VGJ56_25690 [Reyranella sp.]